jgi:large subunit ribosomal protein L10
MPRPEKIHMVKEVSGMFRSSSALFVTGCGGLNASNVGRLRRKLNASASKYIVVKNTVGKLAAEEAGIGSLCPFIEGSTGFVLCNENPVVTSKAVVDFARENEALKIRGGILGKEILSAESVRELASLPPREVLAGTLVSTLKSPIYGLAGVLSGTLRKFVYALTLIQGKKQTEKIGGHDDVK